MDAVAALVLLLGAGLGGFAVGLTGFGYSLLAFGIWLHAVPPQVAAPLSVLCSLASQALTLPQVWRTIDWRRALPFVVGGLAGVPIGSVLLTSIEPRPFKLALGGFLIAYAAFMLVVSGRHRRQFALGGRPADVVIGLAGGTLGGLAGLHGSILVVWATIRGWGTIEKRAVFQAFNGSMVVASAVSHAWAGLHTSAVWLAASVAIPLSIAASWAGHRVYLRLSAQRFDRAVLLLLLLSGAGLLVSSP